MYYRAMKSATNCDIVKIF